MQDLDFRLPWGTNSELHGVTVRARTLFLTHQPSFIGFPTRVTGSRGSTSPNDDTVVVRRLKLDLLSPSGVSDGFTHGFGTVIRFLPD